VRRFLDARAKRAAGRDRAKRPEGLARLASGVNATNESGGEAEIPYAPSRGVWGEVGRANEALTRAARVSHSAAPRGPFVKAVWEATAPERSEIDGVSDWC